jgi:hypothetical protein
MTISMTLHRGEKNQWWPGPEFRLISGMTLREPWLPCSVINLWARLKAEVSKESGENVAKKVAAYAQDLRKEGHPYALATAWTSIGAFDSDYKYVITIPDAHLFHWGGTADAPDIGTEFLAGEENTITADFIVLNAGSIETSTILAFGHKTGTKEVTFFHDLPIDLIESCNGVPTASLGIKKITDLNYDQKIKYQKLLRE